MLQHRRKKIEVKCKVSDEKEKVFDFFLLVFRQECFLPKQQKLKKKYTQFAFNEK